MPSFGSTGNVSGRSGINSGPRSFMKMKVNGIASSSSPVGKWTGPSSGSPDFGGSSLDMAVAEKTGPNFGGTLFNSQKDKVKQQWLITGVTRDSAGATLGNCTVHLFNTINDIEIAEMVSDATGNYSFTIDGNGQQRYAVAYLAGSPDVAGTTVNTLIPVLT